MRAIFATAVSALVSVSLYGCGSDTTTTATTTQGCMNIPALAQSVDSLSTLVSLLVQQNLTETLDGTGPFTVFAPTNDAFAAAQSVIDTLTPEQITDVLLYHVVPGDATAADLTQGMSLATVFTPHNLTVATITPNVTIQPDGTGAADATVTSADNTACNGVVHIVNAVLVPDLAPAPAPGPAANTTAAPSGPTTTQAPATLNIVELAQTVPTLSTLVSLLISNNLTETLSGPGPFTVFAPNDDAFTAASDIIATLTPEQVTSVLTYHVVPDVAAVASDLSADESLTTVFTGHDLTVATIAPNVTIHPDGTDAADATVISANNMATNGVVHIVNAVLVPDLSATSFSLIA